MKQTQGKSKTKIPTDNQKSPEQELETWPQQLEHQGQQSACCDPSQGETDLTEKADQDVQPEDQPLEERIA